MFKKSYFNDVKFAYAKVWLFKPGQYSGLEQITNRVKCRENKVVWLDRFGYKLSGLDTQPDKIFTFVVRVYGKMRRREASKFRGEAVFKFKCANGGETKWCNLNVKKECVKLKIIPLILGLIKAPLQPCVRV